MLVSSTINRRIAMDAAEFSEASQLVYNTLEAAITVLNNHIDADLEFDDLTEDAQRTILLMQNNLCRKLNITVEDLLEVPSRQCVLQAP